MAAQMVNHVYLVGDRATGEALIVDPAYRVADLLERLEADDMRPVGVLASHYHADHLGGDIMGHRLEGVAELLDLVDVPVHVQRAEAEWVAKSTGLPVGQLATHDGGDRLHVGELEITLLHTPGHTPGSQCFLVADRLVSGDTLFLDGCGRTDLPGSDPSLMWDSLQALAALPDDVIVYPGHRYSPAGSGTVAAIRESNYVYRPSSREEWLAAFGG
jgi:glyoxylase-like metal-dependent hydrolase (beta-lactamase superfamily II)